jgi:hypothetical protein
MHENTMMDYRCIFLINQNKKEREYEDIEKSASSLFVEFINKADYGKGINLFRFDIYVSPSINYGLHNDSVYSRCAHLTAHVDYEKFIRGDRDAKIKILLNASLIMIRYLNEKVVIPKDFKIVKLRNDYEKYIESKLLSMNANERGATVIKLFNALKFKIHITKTYEVNDNEIHYDLNDIEYFINDQLADKTFGSSVQQFDFGYEIYDFKSDYAKSYIKTADYNRYGAKNRSLLVVKQFDYGENKNLKPIEQYRILKNAILDSIMDVDKMKKRPKDFDNKRLYSVIKIILNEYEMKLCAAN